MLKMHEDVRLQIAVGKRFSLILERQTASVYDRNLEGFKVVKIEILQGHQCLKFLCLF